MMLKGETFFHKLWYFLRTYVLTLKRFDLFLQGSLLIVILLETNAYLLLQRDASEGYLPKLIREWVMIGAAASEVLFGVLVAWTGRHRRQLALSSWLAVTSATGLVVLAFPFASADPANVELCGGNSLASFYSSSDYDSNATGRITMLILTIVLCALTKVSIWSHGLTYLDDHDPQNGPYFYGILISIRLSLGLSGANWLRATSLREDWWVAHISISMLTLMFAVLFMLFPRRMKNCNEPEDLAVDTSWRASLHRIIRNKALLLQTLALSFLSAAVFCFVQYDKAYVQARFHIETIRQDPRTSRTLSDIFRSLVIIFFVMIFRVRFSARRSDGVKANTASRVAGVVAVFVAVFFAVMAIIGCSTGTIAGVTSVGFQQPSCSSDCGCKSEKYGFSPVCALDTDTTYFSPCHAGCQDAEDLNGFTLFSNCSCSSASERAVRGACTLVSCRVAFSAYQVFYTVMLAVSGACFLLQGMVILRAVRPADKPVAVGCSFALVALLSFVFGHLLYLLISDQTCVYFDGGSCLLHDQSIWIASATSSLLAFLSAIVSLVASQVPTDIYVPTTEL